jgi:hypothetical protein
LKKAPDASPGMPSFKLSKFQAFVESARGGQVPAPVRVALKTRSS